MELLLIADRDAVKKHHPSLALFEERIYLPAFPDPDEREAFTSILDRIGATEALPQSFVVLACREQTVIGGIVCDWYVRTGALEVIYLAISASERKQGIARTLLFEGIARVNAYLASQGEDVKNVYLETNIPSRVSCEHDSMDPLQRLEVFRRLGALHVPIPYVQPALSPTTSPTTALYLFSLPQFNAHGAHIEKERLADFLTDFYAGLGEPASNASLVDMLHTIDRIADGDFVALQPLPTYTEERARYAFTEVALTTHFAVDTQTTATDALFGSTGSRYFHSYETDLLNYENQRMPPFESFFHRKLENARLLLPRAYAYTSEGITYNRITQQSRTQIGVTISVSYSIRPRLRQAVAHLTLQPAAGAHFSELDIIKFATLFGSRQESCTFSEELRIEDSDGQTTTLTEFLNKYLCPTQYLPSEAGLISLELRAAECAGTPLSPELAVNLREMLFHEGRTPHTPSSETREFASALCGMILGIFDFQRMNRPEILDTIRPIVVCPESFTVACRGNLFRLGHDAECETIDHILISPYLLIPSTMIVFNSMLLSDCEQSLQSCTPAPASIAATIDKAREAISSHYLRDIFQYRSEQEIIAAVEVQRNMTQRYGHVVQTIRIMEGILQNKRQRKAAFVETVQSTLLGLIALLQIYPIIMRISDNSAVAHVVFCGCIAALCGVIGYANYIRNR